MRVYIPLLARAEVKCGWCTERGFSFLAAFFFYLIGWLLLSQNGGFFFSFRCVRVCLTVVTTSECNYFSFTKNEQMCRDSM